MQSSPSRHPARPARGPAAPAAGRDTVEDAGREAGRGADAPAVRDGGAPAVRDGGAGEGLGAELAAVVAAARRRAARDGDRQIDTAHLLHSLAESHPEVRAALGAERAARVLAYLVQRSIGYGLRWHGTVEDSGAGAVLRGDEVPEPPGPATTAGAGPTGWAGPAVRDGAVLPGSAVRDGAGPAKGPRGSAVREGTGPPGSAVRDGARLAGPVPAGVRAGWSPAAGAALEAALARARARGEPRARPLDLLAGLAADPHCRAVQVLARAGVDRGLLTARVEHPSQQVRQALRS
ncbi:Clp protease N-terminal domain-containing protein [Streptomyces fradiae]|uniref:Clp protease N-terminal domain-containing protein n=1 Tax=Streptomyces fradiae TaxID=1906 RepID=UPI003684B13A